MATKYLIPTGSALLSGSVAMSNIRDVVAPVSLVIFTSTATAERTLDVVGTSAAVFASTAAAERVLEATGGSSAIFLGTAFAEAILETVGASVAVFLSSAHYEGEENRTWVTGAETGFIGRYTNYEFNSFATVGDRSFAFGDSGIVEIGGAADNGSPIDLYLLGGTDRKDKGIRRPHVGYIVGLVPDDASLFVVNDEGVVFDYPLEPTEGRLDTVRAAVGKGIRARHLRYGVFARATTPMEISTMTMYLADLTRNI